MAPSAEAARDPLPKSSPHYPGLDGFRGVAVMIIFTHHAYGWVMRGGHGVDAFLVLSGFLITFLLVRERDLRGRIGLGKFHLRRAVRLLPAFWFFLAVMVGAALCGAFGAERDVVLMGAGLSFLYAMNWVAVCRLLPHGPLDHLWYMAFDQQAYLLWPVVLAVLLDRVGSRGAVVGWVLALGGASWAWRCALTLIAGIDANRAFFCPDTHADGLMLGSALGVAWASGLMPSSALALRRLSWASPAAAALYGVFAVGIDRTSLAFMLVGFPVVQLLVAVVIWDVVARPGGFVAGLLASRPLLWVGSISYGIYLWHYPILGFVVRTGASAEGIFALSLAATLAVAWLSCVLIETPMLALKKAFK